MLVWNVVRAKPKNFERTLSYATAKLNLCFIRLMLKRLASQQIPNGFYRILEVKPGASQDEIKQAYKHLVKKWHPDLFFKNPKLQLQAQEKSKEINEAYKKLSIN